MTENRRVRTPAKLRQVWPPVAPEDQPRRRYRSDVKLQQVRDLLGWRAMRGRVMDSKLFEDPAWDLLLHVYAAELSNQPATQSELAAALGSPVSAAGCWLLALEEEGLVQRDGTSGPTPGAVRLTDHGMGGMHAFFELLPVAGASAAQSA